MAAVSCTTLSCVNVPGEGVRSTEHAPAASEQLAYYLAANRANAFGKPLPREELPSGPDWIMDEYVTPKGTRVPILRRSEPEFRVGPADIVRAIIYEPVPDPFLPANTPSQTGAMVELKPSDTYRAQLATLVLEGQSTNQQLNLLVVANGQVIGVETMHIELTERLHGGGFASITQAREFYAGLGDRVEYTKRSEAENEAWELWAAEVKEFNLWHSVCDTEAHQLLEEAGADVDAFLQVYEEHTELFPRVDCTATPPELPEGPVLPESAMRTIESEATSSGRATAANNLREVTLSDGVLRWEARAIAEYFFHYHANVGCGAPGFVSDAGDNWSVATRRWYTGEAGKPVSINTEPIIVNQATGTVRWGGRLCVSDPLAMLSDTPGASRCGLTSE